MTQPEREAAGAASTEHAPAAGAAPAAVVAARGIEKSFGASAVLRGLDLTVHPGQIVVVFGPNGAGKTTLFRILATLSRPDAGTVVINGFDTARAGEAARLSLGAVLHSPMLYGDLTVRENLVFYARMFRLQSARERIDAITARLGLRARMEQRARELSHGYQKRVALARALLHEPRLLLLDEAETGLDERAREVLEKELTEHRASGRSVLLTTHAVERGIALADRVLVLANGRFVLNSPASDVDPARIRAVYGMQREAV